MILHRVILSDWLIISNILFTPFNFYYSLKSIIYPSLELSRFCILHLKIFYDEGCLNLDLAHPKILILVFVNSGAKTLFYICPDVAKYHAGDKLGWISLGKSSYVWADLDGISTLQEFLLSEIGQI